MREYILTYAGFSKQAGVCHVITQAGSTDVLVGDLEDNPGTSVLNATEEIGAALSKLLYDGAGPEAFTLFEYDPHGLPSQQPSLYEVTWQGHPGNFAMPMWNPIPRQRLSTLDDLLERVRASDYTSLELLTERDLELIESPEIERRRTSTAGARTVEPREFAEFFRPAAEAILSYAQAVTALCEAARPPSATSGAVREIAAEPDLRIDGWDHPIIDAHTMGALSLRAAGDYAASFADVIGSQKPPLYGHIVLAKAVFEASNVAEWLAESGIAFRVRMQRALYEQLSSAMEQIDLGIDADAPDRLSMLVKRAEKLSWSVDTPHSFPPRLSDIQRPNVGERMSHLLGLGPDARAGEILWHRANAVATSSLWGLLSVVRSDREPNASGFVRAEFGARSSQVATQAYCVISVLQAAASSRAALMGWENDDDWRHAELEIRQTQMGLLTMLEQPL